MAVIQPVLLIFSISVPNVLTIGRHLTSFVTCATFNMYNNSIAYLKNWTDNFFQIFFMGTSWVAVSINNITTRASREMTVTKKISTFSMHWHVAGEVFAISDCLVMYALHYQHDVDVHLLLCFDFDNGPPIVTKNINTDWIKNEWHAIKNNCILRWLS